ncbi:MAG: hypothetical protein QOJ01_2469 [Solirubrobacterales bacterium]|jgi:hypothetical protein|nr:hypothetical protein [Solirubrobacterales bacterium]
MGVVVGAAIGCCATPALVQADTWHASPDGAKSAAHCPQSAPCSLAHAVELSQPGDDVVLAQGNYHVAATTPDACTSPFTGANAGDIGLDVNDRYLHGVAGRPRPRIIGSSATCITMAIGGAGRIRHLELDGTSTSKPETYALVVDGGASAYDVATGGANGAVQMRNGAHLYNSVLNHRPDGIAMRSYFGSAYGSPGTSSYLVNDTVLGQVVAQAPAGVPGDKVDINCLNTLATDGFHDANPASTGASVTMTFSHCMGATVMDGGPSEAFIGTIPPADTAALAPGDGFHELSSSASTINKGLSDPSILFETDIDGGPRIRGSAPDIGADEFGSALPIVDSGKAHNVGSSRATVRAAVTPNGLPTHGFVEFGRTAKYGKKAGHFNAGSGFTTHAVSITLKSLSHKTRYHFRLVATNGHTAGEDRTFKTSR